MLSNKDGLWKNFLSLIHASLTRYAPFGSSLTILVRCEVQSSRRNSPTALQQLAFHA